MQPNPLLINDLRKAMTLQQQGSLMESLAIFEQCLSQTPDFPDVWVMKALVLHQMGRAEEALLALDSAIRLKPNESKFYLNKVQIYTQCGRSLEAADMLALAASKDPRHTDVANWHLEAGKLYTSSYQYEKAKPHFHRVTELKPLDPAGYKALIELLVDTDAFDEALALLDRMIANGETGAARYYKCLIHFLQGDIEKALPYWDSRWKHSGVEPTLWPFPLWKGENLGGKSLLLWGEQGVGDELMFASMIHMLQATGNSVIIQCTSRMIPLFERSFGVKCYPKSATAELAGHPNIVAHLPMGDLLHHFKPLKNFPEYAGYIRPDSQLVTSLKKKYQERNPRPKIGISWHSMNTDTGGLRTVTLEDMLPILRNPYVQFVSVQYGDHREYVASFNTQHGLDIWVDTDIDAFSSMDRFAAQVAALDQVITIANSTVHVAGSMGIPTWALIPKTPSWRWQLHGEGNLWYKHLRLFRQSEHGKWGDAIETMAFALEQKYRAT
jgi:Flp pilus assembly protein TadD